MYRWLALCPSQNKTGRGRPLPFTKQNRARTSSALHKTKEGADVLTLYTVACCPPPLPPGAPAPPPPGVGAVRAARGRTFGRRGTRRRYRKTRTRSPPETPPARRSARRLPDPPQRAPRILYALFCKASTGVRGPGVGRRPGPWRPGLRGRAAAGARAGGARPTTRPPPRCTRETTCAAPRPGPA
jgi:hypothetical protein